MASKDFKSASSKEEAEKLKSQNIETETMLNLEYLYLEVNKNKDLSKVVPTVLMKLMEEKIFSEDFIKIWSKGEIKDL